MLLAMDAIPALHRLVGNSESNLVRQRQVSVSGVLRVFAMQDQRAAVTLHLQAGASPVLALGIVLVEDVDLVSRTPRVDEYPGEEGRGELHVESVGAIAAIEHEIGEAGRGEHGAEEVGGAAAIEREVADVAIRDATRRGVPHVGYARA